MELWFFRHLGYILCPMAVASYYKATKISSLTKKKPVPMLRNTERLKKRWCDVCQAFKNERAHHCSICKACVDKMDHHCPWVVNCIGYRNHKAFWLFSFYAFLGFVTFEYRSACFLDWMFRNNKTYA